MNASCLRGVCRPNPLRRPDEPHGAGTAAPDGKMHRSGARNGADKRLISNSVCGHGEFFLAENSCYMQLIVYVCALYRESLAKNPTTNRMNMHIRKKLCLLILAAGAALGARAQHFAIKTNLLYDATATVNAGIEFSLSRRWTLDLSGNYNGWTIDNHKLKHWLAQPEFRYWFCDRFSRHFLGFHVLGGEYNVGNIKNGISFLGTDFSQLTDRRYQGWAVGGGVAYGYAFILGRHWNLELEAGFGYAYTRYDVYECKTCSRKKAEDVPHHYVGPTKAAFNLVYVF